MAGGHGSVPTAKGVVRSEEIPMTLHVMRCVRLPTWNTFFMLHGEPMHVTGSNELNCGVYVASTPFVEWPGRAGGEWSIVFGAAAGGAQTY